MSDSSGAKKQNTDVDEQFFDRLDGKDGLIKLILSYLTREDGYEYVKYLKEGLFKPKNDDTEIAIQEKKDFMNSLDTFLAKCTRLYHLIQRYREDFPHGEIYRNMIPTPFISAVQTGPMEDIKLFVTLHPFHKYISNSDDSDSVYGNTVNDMVNQIGVNTRGYRTTPLIAAAELEAFEEVKYLIEQGADPTVADNDGRIALHLAVDNRTTTDVVQILLKHMSRSSINKQDLQGATPLDYALEYSEDRYNPRPLREAMITLLRSNGAMANFYDLNGDELENPVLNQLLKF